MKNVETTESEYLYSSFC